MLHLFGRKYAKNNREVIETLFSPGGTANGTYRPAPSGIHLYDLQGTLRAFLRGDGLIVSAVKDGRRIRYLYALTSVDSAWIGAPESYMARCEGVETAVASVNPNRER